MAGNTFFLFLVSPELCWYTDLSITQQSSWKGSGYCEYAGQLSKNHVFGLPSGRNPANHNFLPL